MAKKPVAAAIHESEHVESPMDYAEHERTYNGFMTITKYGVIAMAVLMVLLYFVINP